MPARARVRAGEPVRARAAGEPAGAATGPPGAAPPYGGPLAGRLGLGRLERLLVDARDLLRPRAARRSPPPERAQPRHRAGAEGSSHSERRASASSSGPPGRHEQPVAAVAYDLPVAGDVGRDHRRAGRERLDQHHAEALAAERRRAEHVGLVQPVPQLVVAHADRGTRRPRCRRRARRVGLDAPRSTRRSTRGATGTCSRSPANADSSTGRPLRSSSRPTNRMRKLVRRALRRHRRGGHVDAIGDHRVVAAEVALSRPARRVRDRDARVQLVEDSPCAEQRGDRVRNPLGRIGVERADHRGAVEAARVPADHRRDRLVNVHDVEAPCSQLAAAGERRFPETRTGSRPIRSLERPPCDRAGSGDPAARPARGCGGEGRGSRRSSGSTGRQDAHVVALSQQLRGELVDVAGYSARKSPGVWGDESDAHRSCSRREDEGRPLSMLPAAHSGFGS